jgi:carboxyl-terminal processing protease
LENKGVFYQFAFEYSDANRSKLNEFTSSEDMLNYLKTQPLLYNIIQYAEAKGIKRRSSLITISANQILNTIYAGILQNFFGEEAYFSVILNNDKMVKKAILEIQKGNALPTVVANSAYKSN